MILCHNFNSPKHDFFSYGEEMGFCIYQEYFKQFILRREYLFIYV